jgi:hypothetical protein
VARLGRWCVLRDQGSVRNADVQDATDDRLGFGDRVTSVQETRSRVFVASALWLVSAATGEHIIGWFAGPGFLILGVAYWVMARGAESGGSTWSPFQSPEVRDICAHLTAEERERLVENARRCGRELAVWIVLPVAIASVLFLWSARLGFVGLAVLSLYFVIAVWPRIRAMRLRSQELICQSEWARGRGYTAATLRFFAFPWSS